jgi:hypothetical protein
VSALADELARVLGDCGPLPACDLALVVRRRKADVAEALARDPRFVRSGKRRASRWGLAPPASFDVDEAAVRWRCSRARAQFILFGPGGFLERGFVARSGENRLAVTERGREVSHAIGHMHPDGAA